MKPHSPVTFRDMNLVVHPHVGTYDLRATFCTKLYDATTLLEEASKIIADYADLTGFGGTCRECETWLRNCETYKQASHKSTSTGEDYLGYEKQTP